MVSLLGRDDWGVGGQREVDTWVGYQVGLELSQVYIEGTVKSQRGSDGADNLADQPVQVGVGWSLNVQVSSADIVDGLIVDHEGTVRVLQGGVGGQDGVVGLNDGSGDLWGWVDGKLQLGFLAIVNAETFHKEGGESRSGTTAEAVEDQESLKTGTLISQLPDSVQDKVDDFFANGVVTTGIVVGGVFLAGDQLLGVEQLSVGASSDLI